MAARVIARLIFETLKAVFLNFSFCSSRWQISVIVNEIKIITRPKNGITKNGHDTGSFRSKIKRPINEGIKDNIEPSGTPL